MRFTVSGKCAHCARNSGEPEPAGAAARPAAAAPRGYVVLSADVRVDGYPLSQELEIMSLSGQVNHALAEGASLVGGVSVVGMKLDDCGTLLYRYSQAVLFPDPPGNARTTATRDPLSSGTTTGGAAATT